MLTRKEIMNPFALRDIDDDAVYTDMVLSLSKYHQQANNSAAEPGNEEQVLYYFVTLAHYRQCHTIHIIEYCLAHFAATSKPGVIANIKSLIELLKH